MTSDIKQVWIDVVKSVRNLHVGPHSDFRPSVYACVKGASWGTDLSRSPERFTDRMEPCTVLCTTSF